MANFSSKFIKTSKKLPRKILISAGVVSVSALLIAGCGGGGGGSSAPTTPTTPPAANNAPVVSSASTASLSENSTASFYTLTASDPDGDSLTAEVVASGDGNFFTINSSLQISPAAAFDFEQSNDADGDNLYNISLQVTDARGAATTFALAISVDDVSDNFSYGLQTNTAPSNNFDLLDWKLDLPVNAAGAFEGDNVTIDEDDMAAGYVNTDYFFTAADGGMVFRSPSKGATTSANTRYTRTELREMLRRGDRSISTRGSGDRPNGNNWAFSSAPQAALDDAGGVDGDLAVTLAVNEVTTTGEDFQIGRLIIGQIHAKDDEPIRLYYRKLPDNRRGSIYAVHEKSENSGGDETTFDIIGSSSSSAANPADGILLGETFTYNINATGNTLTVTITKADTTVVTQTIDMTNSGYDVEDDFMYFKVGVYHVNDSADDGEFVQITVYELENTHQGYPF